LLEPVAIKDHPIRQCEQRGNRPGLVSGCLSELHLTGRRLCHAAQRLPDARVVGLELRQQVMSHPVSEEGAVHVGGVYNGFQVVCPRIVLELCPGDIEQRSDKPNAVLRRNSIGHLQGVIEPRRGSHASQPAQPGAPQEMHQHRLRLVVYVMTDGH